MNLKHKMCLNRCDEQTKTQSGLLAHGRHSVNLVFFVAGAVVFAARAAFGDFFGRAQVLPLRCEILLTHVSRLIELLPVIVSKCLRIHIHVCFVHLLADVGRFHEDL